MCGIIVDCRDTYPVFDHKRPGPNKGRVHLIAGDKSSPR